MDLFSLINNNKLSVPLNTSLVRGAGGTAEVPEGSGLFILDESRLDGEDILE